MMSQGKHQASFLLKEEQASHGQILLMRQDESLLLAWQNLRTPETRPPGPPEAVSSAPEAEQTFPWSGDFKLPRREDVSCESPVSQGQGQKSSGCGPSVYSNYNVLPLITSIHLATLAGPLWPGRPHHPGSLGG